MNNRKFLLTGCVFMLLATVSMACGPYFPLAYFPHRDVVLKVPTEGDFAFELGRYSPAIRSKMAASLAQGTDSSEMQRAKAEVKDVTPEQHLQVKRMLSTKDGNEAYALGQGLPEGIRLYTAAAVDYHLARKLACPGAPYEWRLNAPLRGDQWACNRDWCDGYCYPDKIELLAVNKAIQRAMQRFEAVLSLPSSERKPRATWAAYSLGESYLNFKLDDRHAKAKEYYALVRTLANQGNPDPLNLSAASLGQQAFLKLQVGDNADAVKLYMEQGDVNSLRFVAERLVSRPDKFASEIKVRQVRRLLIAYAFAYGHAEPYTGKQAPWVKPLVKSLIASGIRDIENMDRLAAISYAAGNYQDAERLAEKSESPLAHWIKSKLARRNGDTTLAADHIVLATDDDRALRKSLPEKQVESLTIERALVLISRGRPAEAINATYASGARQWPDTAYIAERLLTTTELRAFVDRISASSPKNAQAHVRSNDSAGPVDNQHWTTRQLAARFGYRSTGSDPNDVESLNQLLQLRNLLARRLMREGRHGSALQYFTASDTQTIEYANAYAKAFRLSRQATGRAARAEALFKAGALAREHGMEILGYELAPDFHYAKGNYGADYILFKDGDGPSSLIYSKANMSPEEIARFNATSPSIDRRYHYRYLAVKHGRDAAALVQPRSQAYRAILCHAAAWARGSELKDDLYRTYVQRGSYIGTPANMVFGGRHCETPDFERAFRWSAPLKKGFK
jgi:hypothetical protein